MNITLDEFYEMNKDHIISVEDAALGFAVSLLRAKEYDGQELGSIQVLHQLEKQNTDTDTCDPVLLGKIIATYEEQYSGWHKRNIFERQWGLRDFKKCVGMTADEVYAAMEDMKNCGGRLSAQNRQLLKSMILYWEHQYQLLQGFEKDRQKLEENSNIIRGWIADIKNCIGK